MCRHKIAWNQHLTNALQEESNVDIKFGKDFISLYVKNMEIVMVLNKAKSDHIIDVLVWAPNNTQEYKRMSSTIWSQYVHNPLASKGLSWSRVSSDLTHSMTH